MAKLISYGKHMYAKGIFQFTPIIIYLLDLNCNRTGLGMSIKTNHIQRDQNTCVSRIIVVITF